MKTISVHSYKGGTGKTTFLLNLAGYLAKDGQKSIAIDYDLRAPSFQSYFKADLPYFISDYLLDDKKLSDVVYPCDVDENIRLDLVFSSMEFFTCRSIARRWLQTGDIFYGSNPQTEPALIFLSTGMCCWPVRKAGQCKFNRTG